MHVVVLYQFDYEKVEYLYFSRVLAIGLCSTHLGVRNLNTYCGSASLATEKSGFFKITTN
jgi:hypothetical protein